MPYPDWRPIETFPKDGTDFIVCDAAVMFGFMQVVAYNDTSPGGYTLQTSDGPSFHPDAFTHWMPLPPLPQPSAFSGGVLT
jgi:hypothetical protein